MCFHVEKMFTMLFQFAFVYIARLSSWHCPTSDMISANYHASLMAFRFKFFTQDVFVAPR